MKSANSDWSKQFFESWKKFEGNEYAPTLSIDNLIEGISEGPIIKSLLRTSCIDTLDETLNMYLTLKEKLESPIEEQMFFALQVVARNHIGAFLCRFGDQNFGDTSEVMRLELAPQTVIEGFRVDFKVTLSDYLPDWNNSTLDSNGERIPTGKLVESSIVVECDGHAFHERTKTQVIKDKKRDRTLQSAGFYVFRYTGSEIWTDVFECAQQIYDTLVKMNREQAAR